jgi:hypothetical protein
MYGERTKRAKNSFTAALAVVLACAIRSSVNRHTGMTPNKMMLGREINLPSELIFKNVREELCGYGKGHISL